MTKKLTNIYNKIYSKSNIELAIHKAIQHKSHYTLVKQYKKNPKKYFKLIQYLLKNRKYKVSPYLIINKVTNNNNVTKIRVIPKIPLFPDLVIQHSLLQIIGPKWISSLTDDCYNCIPNRGITSNDLRWNLNYKLNRDINKLTTSRRKKIYGKLYVLKCDIKHHYPSVKHSIFRKAYQHDCKDKYTLQLLDTLNYSVNGLPIGWATGAPGSHIILRKLDHWVKEVLKVKYYYRYADDIVILHYDKKQLHEWLQRIRNFLWYELKQEMKSNYQIFPLSEGIDYGGYVFFSKHTKIRKTIKKAAIKKRHNPKSWASYNGLLKHCDSKNLIKKIIDQNNKHMTSIKDLNIRIERRFDGEPIKIEKIEGENIKILDFDIRESTKKPNTWWMRLQILWQGKKRFVMGAYQDLAKYLILVDRKYLPLEDVVIRNDRGYYFEGTRDIDLY